MNKIIVCNGAYRSGSTWAFNVVLKLVKYTGISGNQMESLGVDQEHADKMIGKPLSDRKLWSVLKIHYYSPGFEPRDHVKIIRTYRNPWAVLASHMYIRGLKDLTDEQIQTFCENQRLARALTLLHKSRPDSLCIEYETLYHLPYEVIDKIDKFIGTKASIEIKTRIMHQLEIEQVVKDTKNIKGWDRYTQWRPNHVSDGRGKPDHWMEVLDEGLMRRVEKVGF